MMAEVDWKSRHPFTVGQKVYALGPHVLGSFGLFLNSGAAYLVNMRGEDAHGSGVAVVGVAEHLPTRLFTAEPAPQMPALIEEDAD